MLAYFEVTGVANSSLTSSFGDYASSRAIACGIASIAFVFRREIDGVKHGRRSFYNAIWKM